MKMIVTKIVFIYLMMLIIMNKKAFTIVELLISVVIMLSLIFSFTMIINKTLVFYRDSDIEIWLIKEVNSVKDIIQKELLSCKNINLVSWNSYLTQKDLVIWNINNYFDAVSVECDNVLYDFVIVDKNTWKILSPELKTWNWWYFVINKDKKELYINKKLNIRNFLFTVTSLNLLNLNSENITKDIKFLRLDLIYDNNLQDIGKFENSINYIIWSDFINIKLNNIEFK